LAPRYIEPFEIIETCGPVAYRICLPSQLAVIHDVFHISQLKKCIKVPTEIIKPQDIEIEPDLSYAEYPIKVLDTKESKSIKFKILSMFSKNSLTFGQINFCTIAKLYILKS
jgi:hypothetical protein